MPTNRTPLARQHTAPIPPAAVAIYQRMIRIHCLCGPPPAGRSAPSPQCAACEKWWDLHSQLDAALGPRKPWLWPHIAPPTRFRDHNGLLRRRQPLAHQAELADRLREAARILRAERPIEAVE
jgi:hypothetical protein